MAVQPGTGVIGACVEAFENGEVYKLPHTNLTKTNLYFRIARWGEVYLKVPSKYARGEHRRLLGVREVSPDDLRGLEEEERFENLSQTLDRFPNLKRVSHLGPLAVHFLLLHALQYHRLKGQSAVVVPRVRFGGLRLRRWGFVPKTSPVIIQEAIEGTTLWDMWDFEGGRIAPRWKPLVPKIAEQLAGLLDSGLENHVDWNIKNFVLEAKTRRLYYVDVKPSLFVPRHSNEQNLAGIRKYFLS